MRDPLVRQGFIAAVLGVPPEEIIRTELLPTYLWKKRKKEKQGILDFVLFPEDEEYYPRFHIWEDRRRRKYTDKLEVHTIELPKLIRRNYPDSELLNWARFLNGKGKEELQMLADDGEGESLPGESL